MFGQSSASFSFILGLFKHQFYYKLKWKIINLESVHLVLIFCLKRPK